MTLLYRASRETDVVFRREIEEIAAQRGARVHFLIGSRAELGHDPLSPRALGANIPDLQRHDVYICGPDGMARASVQSLRDAGVPRRHIHHESFEF